MEVKGDERPWRAETDAETQREAQREAAFALAFANTIRAHQARTALWRRRAVGLLVLSIWLATALLLVLVRQW